MKKILLILIIASLSLLSSSCTYDQTQPPPPPDVVSYKDNIQPIWNQKCTQCHDASGDIPPDLTAANSHSALLNGYVTPGNAEGSSLYQSLTGTGGKDIMPDGGPKLPQDQIDLVKKWIDDGALNN